MNTNALHLAFGIVERAIGRRALWRLGRAAYAFARRDYGSNFETDGERDLQAHIAAVDHSLLILDVGANLGQWSSSLLSFRTDRLRLVCFEPSPSSFVELRKRVPLAEHVQSAVSDYEGVADFSIVGETAGTNTLGKARGARSITVPVTTIAAFAKRQKLGDIDVLKIDAEGFDLSIIRGALPLLKAGRIGVVQFEYNSQWMASRSYLADVPDLIEGTPYTLGKVVPGGIELYEEWRPELERFFEAEYALVRNDMRDVLKARVVRFDPSNTLA